MKYCSDCAAPVVRRWVAHEDRERWVCSDCGVVHYQNPRIIVISVVTWQNSLLMCQRALEPGKGQWALPTGFMECGERLESAAARETFEETGVVLEPSHLNLYAVVDMPGIEQVAIAFRSDIVGPPTLRPNNECLQVAFIPIPDIQLVQFAWIDTMGDGPSRILRELLSREFSIHWHSLAHSGGADFRARVYELKKGE